MSFFEVSVLLADAVKRSQAVYLYCEPEVLDFTAQDSKAELVICCAEGSEMRISLDPKNLPFLWSNLRRSVFSKGRKVFCWNVKNLFSYFRYHGRKDFDVDAAVIDLKVLEAYLGHRHKRPTSLGEALVRAKSLFQFSTWEKILGIYRRVHLPLIKKVLPAVETAGLNDRRIENVVYPYYEIEGQDNGRLGSRGEYKQSFLPHTLGPEDKENLIPRQLGEIFLYYDFRHMEVSMLAWLSKDKLLGELVQTPDVYLAIYEKVFGEKGERSVAKKLFLPVIYGQGAEALSEKIGITHEAAQKAVYRIRELFPDAIAFVEKVQDQAKADGKAEDFFGRWRYFPEKEYRARNFSVQAPAALVCFEKLIRLHQVLLDQPARVVYHVYDGYAVTATAKQWSKVHLAIREVLESDCELAPGLRLSISVKGGRNQNDLKRIG
jgi:uncharacterized protein YoaH (UPF0181 family)